MASAKGVLPLEEPRDRPQGELGEARKRRVTFLQGDFTLEQGAIYLNDVRVK